MLSRALGEVGNLDQQSGWEFLPPLERDGENRSGCELNAPDAEETMSPMYQLIGLLAGRAIPSGYLQVCHLSLYLNKF